MSKILFICLDFFTVQLIYKQLSDKTGRKRHHHRLSVTTRVEQKSQGYRFFKNTNSFPHVWTEGTIFMNFIPLPLGYLEEYIPLKLGKNHFFCIRMECVLTWQVKFVCFYKTGGVHFMKASLTTTTKGQNI